MKKTIIFILIIAVLGGGFYYCLRSGLIDKWLPGTLERIIPGYDAETEADAEGRVSSDSSDAVYVDNVGMLTGLGSGTGQIERFSGEIESQETREYKLENDRTVQECYVEEGDEVKSGQKLFTYDTAKDESDLEQAQIELERSELSQNISEARAELEKEKAAADTEEKRLQALVTENEIKQQELAQEAKQKEIDALKEQIKNATVYSDMDGIVKSINDPSDTSSDTSDSAYITILKTGTYRVKGSVNEQNINAVFEGERVLVFSRVDSSQHWSGTISEIKLDQGGNESSDSSSYYYGSDSSSGSTDYPFYVELENSDGLMLGQHVYIEQDLGQADAKDGLWLYDYYLAQDDDGGWYVWAASADNTLEKRAVEVGEHDDDLGTYSIISGLSVDDYICQPQDELTEGMPVAYNDPSGNAETESIYTWDADYGLDTEDYSWLYDDEYDTEDYSLYYDDDEYYDDEEYYEDDDDYLDYMTEADGTIIID